MKMRLRLRLRLALLALGLALPSRALADGPGLPNLTYTADQLFKPISVFHTSVGSNARGHGNVAMVGGYLFVPCSRDEGKGDGCLTFWDISDPAHPTKVSQVNNSHVREPHGFGFTGTKIVLQSTVGLQFWEFADPLHPVLLRELTLPGAQASDYDHAAWWAFWQAPWVYVGAGLDGLHVVNAADPRNPTRVKTISVSFRVGSTFAVGNLLVLMASDREGLATYDISDPANPKKIVSTSGASAQYSGVVNGNLIITSGNDNKLHTYDISDPTKIVNKINSPSLGDKGGYPSFQDGFAISGFSSLFARIPVATGTVSSSQKGTSGISGRDEDFATTLGNLVFVGSDHPVGSGFFPISTTPDTTGPTVNMVVPKNGATNQSGKSRIGLTLTDHVKLSTVTSSTFIVRPTGGSAIAGTYSGQGNVINFAPAAALQAGVTYEVVVPAGGVRDLAGNTTPGAFASSFTVAGARTIIGNLSVADSANASDWSVQTNLQEGDDVYGDRAYTFSSVPADLVGKSWIRTANDSKTSALSTLATFTVSAEADVDVGLNANGPVPSWVDGTWINTGTTIATRESSSTTRTFRLFQKHFDAAATVTLGPWNSTTSMYMVVVK
jgi:hypothetical protein